MAAGELYINNKDAYTTWGISMDTSSLSSLMTPPPMKDFIENKSRLEHGKRVITSNPKIDERDITLTFNLTAKMKSNFFHGTTLFVKNLLLGYCISKANISPILYIKLFICHVISSHSS
ncbi:hypothetical protein ACIXR5_12490 [Bacteroides fragilis]